MKKKYTCEITFKQEIDLNEIIENYELTKESDFDEICEAVAYYTCEAVAYYTAWFDDDVHFNMSDDIIEQVIKDIQELLK